MSPLLALVLILAIGAAVFVIGRQRALAQAEGQVKPHSRPHYHGW